MTFSFSKDTCIFPSSLTNPLDIAKDFLRAAPPGASRVGKKAELVKNNFVSIYWDGEKRVRAAEVMKKQTGGGFKRVLHLGVRTLAGHPRVTLTHPTFCRIFPSSTSLTMLLFRLCNKSRKEKNVFV